MISIRAAIHQGGVQVVENDIYGLMVNYTSRIQHVMRFCGIAVSREARTEIERKLGPNFGGLGEMRRLRHAGIKDFGADSQEVWEIVTREIIARRVAHNKLVSTMLKNEPPKRSVLSPPPHRPIPRIPADPKPSYNPPTEEQKEHWTQFLLKVPQKPD